MTRYTSLPSALNTSTTRTPGMVAVGPVNVLRCPKRDHGRVADVPKLVVRDVRVPAPGIQ
jgi:hypothetical protein